MSSDDSRFFDGRGGRAGGARSSARVGKTVVSGSRAGGRAVKSGDSARIKSKQGWSKRATEGLLDPRGAAIFSACWTVTGFSKSAFFAATFFPFTARVSRPAHPSFACGISADEPFDEEVALEARLSCAAAKAPSLATETGREMSDGDSGPDEVVLRDVRLLPSEFRFEIERKKPSRDGLRDGGPESLVVDEGAYELMLVEGR